MDAEKAKNLQKAYQGVKQAVNLVEAMETETKKDLVKDSCPKSGDNRPLDEENDVLLVLPQKEVEKQKADLETAQNSEKSLKKELAKAVKTIDQQKSKFFSMFVMIVILIFALFVSSYKQMDIEYLKWKIEIKSQDMGKMEKAIAMAKTLIGESINAKDANGTTKLHLASQEGRFEEAETLIRLGADINSGNNKKKYPAPFSCCGRTL